MSDYPDPQELRRRAERRLRANEPEVDALRSPLEVERMLHELQVHQIELEMQNEELRYVRDQSEVLLARYTDLYEFAPTGYLSVNTDGVITTANLTASTLLEVDRSFLLRRRMSYFLRVESRSGFDAFLARVFAGDVSATCDVSPLKQSLETVHLRIEGARSHDATEARLVMVDISDAFRATEALRLHSAALEAAATSIMITSAAGVVDWVNPGFTALTGYPLEEAVGQGVSSLMNSGTHDRAFFADLWSTILSGRVWRGEVRNRRKDGSEYCEERSITPFVNTRGAVIHFISMGRDVTQQRQMEAQLQQSQKMETVGRLAGGIAHDFNNLLTVINGTVELVLADMPAEVPLRRDLEEIKAAGVRAALLTRQLLAFSRKQVMRFDSLDLDALVLGLQDMLSRLLGERISLNVDSGADGWLVRADPIQMEQVILNLAVNARDAMEHGGTLTLETAPFIVDEAFVTQHPAFTPGEYVRLIVSDTGVGMAEAIRARAFEPFFTTKALGEGTGLGLSMVYGIITQTGGRILIGSEVGVGTSFSIYLPRVQADTLPPAPEPIGPHARGSETILVVEDDDAVRRVAVRVLEHAGYTVVPARNGRDALTLLVSRSDTVDLVITDIVMPEMGGLEMAARVRESYPGMRVIFLSGYTDQAMMLPPASDLSSTFIGKPYTTSQLTARVREVLDA